MVTAMVSSLQAIDAHLAALAARPTPVPTSRLEAIDARLAALSRPTPHRHLIGLGVAAATVFAFLVGGAVGASVVFLWG
jgi:hypothetical protein